MAALSDPDKRDLAPAALRRPSAVTIAEADGFAKPVPVWE